MALAEETRGPGELGEGTKKNIGKREVQKQKGNHGREREHLELRKTT